MIFLHCRRSWVIVAIALIPPHPWIPSVSQGFIGTPSTLVGSRPWSPSLTNQIQFRSITTLVGMSSSSYKTIYDVPRSGWTSPDWNWGSAYGTGHDCALVCRQRYGTRINRSDLVDRLMKGSDRSNDVEEIKLVLALAWQRGRWDGSDGGLGGYGEVLVSMAEAQRYEEGDTLDCYRRLLEDMKTRFEMLDPTEDDLRAMNEINIDEKDIEYVESALRRCSGLVLKAMGFIENGL